MKSKETIKQEIILLFHDLQIYCRTDKSGKYLKKEKKCLKYLKKIIKMLDIKY